MASPSEEYIILRIIVSEIVFRHIYLKSLVDIPEILSCKSSLVVLLMSQHEYLPSVFYGNNMRSHFT